jgi:hypothetical protein
MRRRMLLVLAGLASVLACSQEGNVLSPQEAGPEAIVVVRDELSFQQEATTIDFEGLPANGSSCPAPFQEEIANPLTIEGVAFTAPICLSTGFCSSPSCPEENILLILEQGSTIDFQARNRGALLEIEGMGDAPFVLEVTNGAGRTVTVEETGIPYGTRVLGFRSGRGITQIRVVRVGPTPDCPEGPCGPLALARLTYTTR